MQAKAKFSTASHRYLRSCTTFPLTIQCLAQDFLLETHCLLETQLYTIPSPIWNPRKLVI